MNEPRPLRAIELLEGVVRNLPRMPGQLAALPRALQANPERLGGIGAVLERNARRFGPRPALRFDGETWSWGRLHRRVCRWAAVLASHGIGAGDVVAIRCGNRPGLLTLVGALAHRGAVAALLNPELCGDALAHALETAGACAVAADPEHADGLDGERRFALCQGSEEAPEGWIDLRMERATTVARTHVRLREPALYIYTSGTTGLPKAAVLSHLRWVKAGAAYGGILAGLRSDDVVYCPLPFFHSLALVATWSGVCAAGACLALDARFSASGFWDAVRAASATVFPYIGEIPRYLLAQPPRAADRSHRVRAIYGVGMRPEVWEPFQERFGIPAIYETYGASEGNLLFLNVFNLPRTIGWTLAPHRLLRYDRDAGELERDAAGRPIESGRGEPGLLVSAVSPRFDFDGYTDAQASEKKLLRDLFAPGDCWFDSGDLLVSLGFGHVAFVDRVGDTFRWKSENISTLQVETAVGAHPAVADCAVYGVEVPGQPGRAGMVAIVAAPGELPWGSLLRSLQAALPGAAVPVFARLVASLETTGTFKNQKAGLKAAGFSVGDRVLIGGEYLLITEEVLEGLRRGGLRL